jgi:hypothetical protein
MRRCACFEEIDVWDLSLPDAEICGAVRAPAELDISCEKAQGRRCEGLLSQTHGRRV